MNFIDKTDGRIWAPLFVDEQEIYASCRNTGSPRLTSANFLGNITNVPVLKRLKHPMWEYSVNSVTLGGALKNKGAGNLLVTCGGINNNYIKIYEYFNSYSLYYFFNPTNYMV